MKLNTLLLLAALIWILFGFFWLITPQYSIPNNTDNEIALVLVQHLGKGSFVLGLLAWFTRKLTDTDARRLIILIFILAFVLDALINVMGIISGTLTSFDWLFVGIDALFAAGFSYYRFIKPE